MKTVLVAAFLAVTWAPSVGAQDGYDPKNPLVACYYRYAQAFGANRCVDPSSSLVPAVFGACQQTEYAAVASDAPSPAAGQNVRDIAVHTVRQHFGPVIQSWIAAAQIANCPSK